jgi:nucleotide-binding universal stress UspA family protein
MIEEVFIPAELIPTVVRDDPSGENLLDMKKGKVLISEPMKTYDKMVLDIENWIEPPIKIMITATEGEMLVRLGYGYFVTHDASGYFISMDRATLDRITDKEIYHISSMISTNESYRLQRIRKAGESAYWPDSTSGGVETKLLVKKALKRAEEYRVDDATTIEEHELSHVAFIQQHARSVDYVDDIVEGQRKLNSLNSRRRGNPTQEEKSIYISLNTLGELNSMLVEMNGAKPGRDWMYYYRIAESLSDMRNLDVHDKSLALYDYVIRGALQNDLSIFDCHLVARLVILFGKDILVKDPYSTQLLDEVALFGINHIPGPPSHEEMVQLLAQIREKERELLEGDKESFYARMQQLSKDITPFVTTFLKNLDQKVEILDKLRSTPVTATSLN